MTKMTKQVLLDVCKYWPFAFDAYNDAPKTDRMIFVGSDVATVTEDDTDVTIAVRGSDDKDDWRCNLAAWNKHPSGLPAGIADAALGIVSALGKLPLDKKMNVVGHSRGAWIATGVARLLLHQGYYINFGGFFATPQQSYKTLDLPNCYAIFNRHDATRRLLTLSALGYRTQGQIIELPDGDWRKSNRLSGLLPWVRIRDHRPWSYDAAITELRASLCA